MEQSRARNQHRGMYIGVGHVSSSQGRAGTWQPQRAGAETPLGSTGVGDTSLPGCRMCRVTDPSLGDG